MNTLAKNLNELMKLHNVSQTQMAKYLNIGQQTVSKYIHNKVEPSLDTVIKIARYFEVTVGYLLGVED